MDTDSFLKALFSAVFSEKDAVRLENGKKGGIVSRNENIQASFFFQMSESKQKR